MNAVLLKTDKVYMGIYAIYTGQSGIPAGRTMVPLCLGIVWDCFRSLAVLGGDQSIPIR